MYSLIHCKICVLFYCSLWSTEQLCTVFSILFLLEQQAFLFSKNKIVGEASVIYSCIFSLAIVLLPSVLWYSLPLTSPFCSCPCLTLWCFLYLMKWWKQTTLFVFLFIMFLLLCSGSSKCRLVSPYCPHLLNLASYTLTQSKNEEHR